MCSIETHFLSYKPHFPMRRSQRFPVPATEISLCAALTQAHASNCDGNNRDYERP